MSMCFSSGRSLWIWKQSWQEYHDANPPQLLSEAEMDDACSIWEQFIWPMLDHDRHYCMNPLELVKAILREKTFPAVDDRFARRQYLNPGKDADMSGRLRDIFAQSPPASWRGERAWLLTPGR